MQLFIISLMIIVAIVFYNIGKKNGIKKASAQKAEQQKSQANENVADKEINLPAPEGCGGIKNSYKIEYDPVVAMYARPNKQAVRQEKQKAAEKAAIDAAVAEALKKQQNKIPWGMIGALGPDVVRKIKEDSERKK